MKTRAMFPILIALILAVPATLAADDADAFDRLLVPYEAVRLALLNDDLGAVSEPAKSLAVLAATAAGGSDDPVLDEIRNTSREVAEASDLDTARGAFGTLSRAMVQYRKLQTDPAPVVAFCSMAQQVWLQPKGEIGNPYYGQSMARCGEVVSE